MALILNPSSVPDSNYQMIDLSKLKHGDYVPSYQEIMEVVWDYQQNGFQKMFEKILHQESKRRNPYYIAWVFKPHPIDRRILESNFFILDVPLPVLLAVTLFKVDNKESKISTVYSLPYDAPKIKAPGKKDTDEMKLHPHIAESLTKIKSKYKWGDPLKSV